MPPEIVIREATDADRAWIRERIDATWGGLPIVSQSGEHDPSELPGLVALDGNELVAHATYRVDGHSCELVTIDTERQWMGLGTALLAEVEAQARAAGCGQLWLNTTNDNVDALRFYQRRGFQLQAVHAGRAGVIRAKSKPQMAKVGSYGIPITDLLELSKKI